MTRRLQTIKRKMLADREMRGAYEALGDEFDLAQELIAARARWTDPGRSCGAHGHDAIRGRAAGKRGTNAQREHAFEVCQGYAVASDNQTSCRVAFKRAEQMELVGELEEDAARRPKCLQCALDGPPHLSMVDRERKQPQRLAA